MKEHLRFAIAYWHSFCGDGSDPFGPGTHHYPWDVASDARQRAKDKADAAFEFITKIGAPYYCFHDVDAIDGHNDPKEFASRVEFISDIFAKKQADSGVKLLWGTANLFSNERYMVLLGSGGIFRPYEEYYGMPIVPDNLQHFPVQWAYHNTLHKA